MAERRFYWMKFQRDFFKSLRIKKLRRLAGGDTFTIIYLKLQLFSITTEGTIKFRHVLETFAEEMAEEIDEDLENVQLTIAYLLSCELMVQIDEDTYFLPYAAENIGSECASAERVRNLRERQKALHCNTPVTNLLRACNVEKEIEIDKEIDKKRNIKEKKPGRNIPPTLDEVKEYCLTNQKRVDPEKFWNYYQSNGWKVGRNTMKDWHSAIATWERNDYGRNSNTQNETEREPKYRLSDL